ncbi:hypothetical protein [Halobacillus litoralis]|nr:hypothetical protein [Halobacillus litoralis]
MNNQPELEFFTLLNPNFGYEGEENGEGEEESLSKGRCNCSIAE